MVLFTTYHRKLAELLRGQVWEMFLVHVARDEPIKVQLAVFWNVTQRSPNVVWAFWERYRIKFSKKLFCTIMSMNGKGKFKMSHEAEVALLECLGTSHMFHIAIDAQLQPLQLSAVLTRIICHFLFHAFKTLPKLLSPAALFWKWMVTENSNLRTRI